MPSINLSQKNYVTKSADSTHLRNHSLQPTYFIHDCNTARKVSFAPHACLCITMYDNRHHNVFVWHLQGIEWMKLEKLEWKIILESRKETKFSASSIVTQKDAHKEQEGAHIYEINKCRCQGGPVVREGSSIHQNLSCWLISAVQSMLQRGERFQCPQ